MNQECQRAIAPFVRSGDVNDYLKDCHNLGSETQTIQILAEAMAAAFKRVKRMFVCGDRSHLKSDCPKNTQKKNKTTKKPPECPQCHKGTLG